MKNLDRSPGLSKALAIAQALAHSQGAEAVLSRHLLHGLLAEEEGLPYRLLQDAGVNLDAFRVPGIAAVAGESAGLALGPPVQHILRRANELAGWHATEGIVTTDLVLLALIEADDAIRHELVQKGLDWPRLQRHAPLQAPPLELDEPLRLADGPGWLDVARIIDAAANRAREGFRVLEDFARLALDDAFLTRRLKSLRHELAAALSVLPTFGLLQARSTLEDVGTDISTPDEGRRDAPVDVVQANARRLQEALRSLEEFGKLHSPDLGEAVEKIRYQAYTLERSLLIGQDARTRLAEARLYVLVTEKQCRTSLFGTVGQALEGGADVIQLREKDVDDRTLLDWAREIRKMTRDHDALFIVNDRPDIAVLAGADGVHLGQDDVPVRAARRIVGPDVLIGRSTHNLEQVRAAVLEGVSYLGLGPTFPSATKTFEAFPGLDFLSTACRETTLPAFALGGITVDNLDKVLATGARRVAVSHSICAADDPAAAAREFQRRLRLSET